MQLLDTEAGNVVRAVLRVLSAAPPERAQAQRALHDAVHARLEAEQDAVALEALALFEQDAQAYPIPLLVVLANKANQDAGYRAQLRELVLAAGDAPG